MVRHLQKHWLTGRISASQREEADLVCAQIDFAPGEAVRPLRGQLEAAAQQAHSRVVVGAAQEDQRAIKRGIQIGLEAFRKRSTHWSLFSTRAVSGAVGGHVGCRGRLELGRSWNR